jgi:hypothetical protein
VVHSACDHHDFRLKALDVIRCTDGDAQVRRRKWPAHEVADIDDVK